MDVLDDATVDAALGEGIGWERRGAEITKSTRHTGFADALAYVNAVGSLAEEMDHHPDIDLRWRTLHLFLVTHSAGGVTALDLELARRIDALLPG